MKPEELIKILPEWNEIDSVALKEKGILAFGDALERGGWGQENLALCPVSLERPGANVTLVEHIRVVTQCSLACWERLCDFPQRHGITVRRDFIICGALLHDIGKFVEYNPCGDRACLSKVGRQMKHPLIGAIIASQHELPNEIIQIIAMHSSEGNSASHTIESNIVRTVDRMVFDTMVYGILRISGETS